MGKDFDSHSEQPQIVQTEWLDTNGAAELLKISEAALRNLTSQGKVPYYKLGRRNRYRLDDLQRLLSSNRRGPVTEEEPK